MREGLSTGEYCTLVSREDILDQNSWLLLDFLFPRSLLDLWSVCDGQCCSREQAAAHYKEALM